MEYFFTGFKARLLPLQEGFLSGDLALLASLASL